MIQIRRIVVEFFIKKIHRAVDLVHPEIESHKIAGQWRIPRRRVPDFPRFLRRRASEIGSAPTRALGRRASVLSHVLGVGTHRGRV